MEFRNKDPGAVQFGNFINYYQFNSAEERLKLLPKDVWSNKNTQTTAGPYLVLDVGCNSGVFTQLLYEFLPNVLLLPKEQIFILGIDIDEKLIERARTENKYAKNVYYECVDVMDTKFEAVAENFLSRHRKTASNLLFDAICCFSITMWIHLNHDDAGLKTFLHKLSNLAHLFVVEPQPWKCYQTAERRLKKAGEEFPLFLKLQWRSNVEYEIQNYLEQVLNRMKIAECDPTKWKRRICFYR